MKKDLLTISNLSKTAKEKLFQNVSFSIKIKEALSVYCSNENNIKSLFECISGIDHADSGEVYLQDKLISKLSQDDKGKLRNLEIGIAADYLLPSNIKTNVFLDIIMKNLKEENKRERLQRCLKFIGLSKDLNITIKDLEETDKIKLSILTSIINSPKIILFYNVKPLDKIIQNLLNKTLKDKGISTILFSTDLNSVKNTRIYKLKN